MKARNISFDTQTAIEYGVNEAIMIQNFVFWLEKNFANGKHEHDGRTWTYNTQEAFSTLFPFWNAKQIWRILDSLERQEVIIKGNYNQHGYDRTCWYAFKDEEKWLNKPSNPHEHSYSENGKWRFRKRKMQIPKTENADSENGTPIPDTFTNTLTDNNHNEPTTLADDVVVVMKEIFKTESDQKAVKEKLVGIKSHQMDVLITLKNAKMGKNISNPVGYLTTLCTSVNNGTFTASQAPKPVQVQETAAERIKREEMRLKADNERHKQAAKNASAELAAKMAMIKGTVA